MLFTKALTSRRLWCVHCKNELTEDDVSKMVCPACGAGAVSIFKSKDAEVCTGCRDHILTAEDRKAGRCSACGTKLPKPGAPQQYKKATPSGETLRDASRQTTSVLRPVTEAVGKCPECGADVFEDEDGERDHYCRSCGAKLGASKSASSRLVPLAASTRELLAFSTPAAGETVRDAIDRTVREAPEAYAAHVAAVVSGDGVVVKAQTAGALIEEAVDVIVSKSQTSRDAARAAFMATETGRALYDLHRRQAAVDVS